MYTWKVFAKYLPRLRLHQKFYRIILIYSLTREPAEALRVASVQDRLGDLLELKWNPHKGDPMITSSLCVQLQAGAGVIYAEVTQADNGSWLSACKLYKSCLSSANFLSSQFSEVARYYLGNTWDFGGGVWSVFFWGGT